jgi:protein-L-isoaspartate(D-aspartate) O-methyltransferase
MVSASSQTTAVLLPAGASALTDESHGRLAERLVAARLGVDAADRARQIAAASPAAVGNAEPVEAASGERDAQHQPLHVHDRGYCGRTMRAALLVAALAAAVADADTARRDAMVRDQIAARGVSDARVLAAMRKVPRHLFVPAELRERAYEDRPLSIGQGQTISQPYIVARMTALLGVRPESRVLEIGTGSAYQAAVLAELAREVYTIEIVPELARAAAARLKSLGYAQVKTRLGDGYRGWPEAAPFDAIIVTASPDTVPPALTAQLKEGGRLVIPVKERLLRITRTAKGLVTEELDPVRFVPMTGEAERRAP